LFRRVILSVFIAIVLIFSAIAPAYAMPTSTMKMGSKGPDVLELQQKLVENGYLDKEFATGFFGPNTEDAVKKYQKENGISQTGIVAEKTLEAMFVKKDFDITMTIRNGDESAEVRKLQQALCDMGYLEKDNVTGYFGDVTEKAVKTFQKNNGIQETGIAAKQTLDKINTIINGTKLEKGKVYKSGDENAGVKELQRRLYELGYLEEKYVTGYYGAITVSAVKKFQKNNQISETGTVAELTLEALNSASAKLNKVEKPKTTATATAKPSQTPKPQLVESIAKPGTLRYGDKGKQVQTLQNNLKKLGYFKGEATGEFGNVTKQAVIKFQKAYSLTADGIAGNKTLAKITAALSGAKPSESTNNSSNTSTPSTTGPSQSVDTSTTVSNYKSANMDVVNAALKTLTEDQLNDVKLMAKVIKREAGGNSYKCQLAVGNVIMNRVKKNNQTVRQVIYAPHQFSTANSTLEKETYSTTNYYAAIEAYMGVKPVGNCLFFCHKSIRYTCWAGKNRTYYATIDSECFFL